MPERGGGSPGELTPQRVAQPIGESAIPRPFALVMERAVFEKLSQTPAGEDPAFYPITVLNEFNYVIVNRDDIRRNPGGQPYADFGEHAAPMKETIRKVKTAYEIIAYPHCKSQGRRDAIEAELVQDRRSFERDEVVLNTEELIALSKLTMARKLPFDPQKRVYKYDEVFHPTQPIEPALNGAQFIRWRHAQDRAKEQGNKR